MSKINKKLITPMTRQNEMEKKLRVDEMEAREEWGIDLEEAVEDIEEMCCPRKRGSESHN